MKKRAKLIFIRAVTLAVSFLIQAAILIIPWIFLKQKWNNAFVVINVLFNIISVLVVIYIVRNDTNPEYKIPWIIFILIFPFFGGIAYLMYGKWRFSRNERKRYKNTAFKAHNANHLMPVYTDDGTVPSGIMRQFDYLNKNADAHAFTDTKVTYYDLGDNVWPVMLEELKKAEKYIFMEYYIIAPGDMLESILTVLEEKAAAGVDVRFMYDSFGSIMKAPYKINDRLKAAGIKVFEFNSFRHILDSRYNNRDHRKMCIIDGITGFTGGVNLADEYINHQEMYGHWKDASVMLKGRGVWSMVTLFLALWDDASNSEDDFNDFIPDYSGLEPCDEASLVAPYTDYPFDHEQVGRTVYCNILAHATHYVYIMTPYLIVDNVMLNALESAAKSGVDVRLITPGIPDKKLVFWLTQSYYASLLQAGVRIYQYDPGFIHSKVFLSDDAISVVGTINLDYRSLTHHFENAVLMYNTKANAWIYKDFIDTFEKCSEITPEFVKNTKWYKKAAMPVLRLLSPLM